MKIYTHDAAVHRASSAGLSAAPELPPLAPGVSWIRFGRETLLYTDEQEPASAQRSSRGARYPRRDADVTREQLHVVVQHGRRFQQQHPDVPVLHDRGRFLLVKLDPGDAQRFAQTGEMCYGITPVTDDMVVFDRRAPSAGRARDPVVTALTEKLDADGARDTLERFARLHTRHSTSAGFSEAAAFAAEQLDALGYSTATTAVPVGSGTSRNVVADKQGTSASPRDIVIVTAHLDSINAAGGASAVAPGADDNASGCTGVLQIARAFEAHQGRHDLRFILFGGEEQGLFGSRSYVSGLAAEERARIRAVVNMDMIGCLNAAQRSVLLEGGLVSQPVIDGLAEAAGTYTQLAVETSLHPFNSDHVPFIDAGMPAVLTIEGADNTNETVHSAGDTADRIDYDLLLDILRMNVAFVAGALG